MSPALFGVYEQSWCNTKSIRYMWIPGDNLVDPILLYVLFHLVHLGCNIFWICVITCMLLTINYLTMQRSHFLCVLNQIALKLNLQTLQWGKKLSHLLDQCKYLSIIISVKNSDPDLKTDKKILCKCLYAIT